MCHSGKMLIKNWQTVLVCQFCALTAGQPDDLLAFAESPYAGTLKKYSARETISSENLDLTR
jgi:hypothetical protein